MDVEITCSGKTDELGNAYFTIRTNLPDNTNLIVTVNGTSGDVGDYTNINYSAQSEAVVVDGSAVAGTFRNGAAPLIMGKYNVNITMPFAGVQSEDVQQVIGEKGRNLHGDSVVLSETEEKYVEHNIVWEMENLTANLSTRELSLWKGGMATATVYRSLSAYKNKALHLTEFNFSRAIVESLNSDVAKDNTLEVDSALARIDYTATIYDFDNGIKFEQDEKDAFLCLKKEGGVPAGSIVYNEQWSEIKAWEWISNMYSEECIEVGFAYLYTEDELQRVNLALNQFIGWLELEFPTAEDWQILTEKYESAHKGL